MLAVVSDIPLSFVSPAKLLMVHSVQLGGRRGGEAPQIQPKNTLKQLSSVFLVHEIVRYRGTFTVLH